MTTETPITTKTETRPSCDGSTRQWVYETREVTLTVGGECRVVEAEKLISIDGVPVTEEEKKHPMYGWHVLARLVGTYPTGKKLHFCGRWDATIDGTRAIIRLGHRMTQRTANLRPIAFYDAAKHGENLAFKKH